MTLKQRPVLTFTSDERCLRVVDLGAQGLAFSTERGQSPRGISLNNEELSALEDFISRWRRSNVA